MRKPTYIMVISVLGLAPQLGVHPQTIRRWDRAGTLPADFRTPGGHRRYRRNEGGEWGETIGYVRVSSHDQKEDLERQRSAVAAGAAQAGKPCDRIISDLGSGMNYQKRGFLQLLTLLLAGKVKTLVLATRTGSSASDPRLFSVSARPWALRLSSSSRRRRSTLNSGSAKT